MNEEQVKEKVVEIICRLLDQPAEKVTMEATYAEDLGADSLDTYELVYAIEEELGISIPDEKANEFETVKDALTYIQSELAKK